MRARYYDPEIGRFISEDSFRGKDSDPLSLNLYTYCMNNPVIFVDPSGHEYGNVTDFVDDYDGSFKCGKEILGYNVTFTYKDGSTKTDHYNYFPLLYISNGTKVTYTPISRGYADISIGDNTRRFYYDSYDTSTGKMRMERTDFAKVMGFRVDGLNKKTQIVKEAESRQANGWFYFTTSLLTGGISSSVVVNIATNMAGIYGPDVKPVGTYSTTSYYVYIPNSKILSNFGKIEVYSTVEFRFNGKLKWVETNYTTSY